MFGIEKRIEQRIVSFFKRRGFSVSIEGIKMCGITRLEFRNIVLSKEEDPGQYAEVGQLTARISFWRSLIHFSIEGEVIFSGITTDLRVVSDAVFSMRAVEAVFRVGRKRKIARLEIEGIPVFLRCNRYKAYDEFFLQIPPTTWDDLIAPIRPYLRCPWVKEAHSLDKLSLLAHYRRGKTPEVPHFFNAEINANDFSLAYPEGTAHPRIDRLWLQKTLTDRLGVSYVPFGQIPKTLVNAFVCTEDPQFWKHAGVSPYFIGYALGENLKHKKIARGASTISMQVARNLFLNHNRTLLRKAEEGIIALLLENYHKIGKQAILELYVNLIEFAPDVYGVADASRFYFDKDVCELSLAEILTLTYIIPRPLHFYQALLDKTEQLWRNLRTHIRTYASTMAYRGMINPSDEQNLDYCIRFSPSFGTLDLTEQA